MRAGLTFAMESEPFGHTPKLLRASARHLRLRIERKRQTPVPIFFSDQIEEALQFHKGFRSRRHERIATLNRGDLGNQTVRLIPIQNDFVIVDRHLFSLADLHAYRFKIGHSGCREHR